MLYEELNAIQKTVTHSSVIQREILITFLCFQWNLQCEAFSRKEETVAAIRSINLKREKQIQGSI